MLLKIESGGMIEAQMLKEEFGIYFANGGVTAIIGIDNDAGNGVIIYVPMPYVKASVLKIMKRIQANALCRAQLRKPTEEDRGELEEVHSRLMAGDMVEEILAADHNQTKKRKI